MSRFFDLVSKPAREMGTTNAPNAAPAAKERRPQLIKLDSNESPFGPSASALNAMRRALNTANFYPDDDCSQLRTKLAAHHELPAEQVLVTAGSTALLGLLCQTLLTPGLNAVPRERSFIVLAGGAGSGRTSDRSADARRQFRSGGNSQPNRRGHAHSLSGEPQQSYGDHAGSGGGGTPSGAGSEPCGGGTL